MIHIAADEDRATAQAAAWLARLQRHDLGETDGPEFDSWLIADPANATAFRRALDLWHEFDEHATEVSTLVTDQLQRVARPDRRWLIGLGGMAAAGALAVAVLPSVIDRPREDAYVTGKGEHRRVTLADGSIVDINAETRLTVRLGARERAVQLAEGEAIFEVAHDAARPFTVAASDRIVRVVGTQFDVRSRSGELTVTVADGKVQVRPAPAATSRRAFLLTPGQRLEVDQAGTEAVKAVDPLEAFAWRSGRLVYRGEALSGVVEDLNRQFTQQIEIGDAELARMPITGVIVLDDPNAVMSRLTLMLPIRTVPSERGLLLLRK